ncbi:MAG: hypothetical protein OMM_04331 [Candidatus Magnetoglobus multicellularis str. Araruama]|uniref:Purple acid phosphatase N-terminal domain-containing protein n=1 Tax=Candidatus Magnetoglobus multicellularis str. Araruama TaxID=890399 RepID=A0A1V1P1R7_9BACT|nr:MAG: hypothetical protein OMM_04331 [Candidatus Magnetoglobus multicellularis str. Araruama]
MTTDCNDSDANIHPGATEIPNNIDDDCDGHVDENFDYYFLDADGDGYGNPDIYTTVTSLPEGYTTDNTDCNDNNPSEYPGKIWYKDADSDGYTDGTFEISCLLPSKDYTDSHHILGYTDCNDNNPSIHEGCSAYQYWYEDKDNDGYGNSENEVYDNTQPEGYVLDNTDCNDNDPHEHSGQTWYKDSDNDNHSDGTTNTTSCTRPVGYKTATELQSISDDPDDSDPTIPASSSSEVTYEIRAGWNLINLSLRPETPLDSNNLALEINNTDGSLNKIQKWDGSGWATYAAGAPFGIFDIEMSKGYFLLASEASQWVNQGDKPVCLEYVFNSGWNLYGFPIGGPFSTKTLAQDINDHGGNITKIQKWDGSGWITYAVGAPFGDFAIDTREGYFLLSDNTSNYNICLFKVSNVRDTQFTISWTSESSEEGIVNYGKDKNLGNTAFDERGQNSFTTHHVSLTSLEPDTTYYYEVVSGTTVSNNGGKYFTMKTGPTGTIPSGSFLCAGKVFQKNGSTPAAGTLVYIMIKDKDSLGTTGSSALQSVLVSSDGYWNIELVNTRTTDFKDFFSFTENVDSLIIQVDGGAFGTAQTETPATEYGNGMRPDIILQ